MNRLHVVLFALMTLGISSAAAIAGEHTFGFDPAWWSKHVPLSTITIAKQRYRVIVDTGGYGEVKKSAPKDFETYYRGLPIDAVIGADTLARSILTVGDSAKSKAVPLRLRTAWMKHELYGFLRVSIDTRSYTMLFDTGALAWDRADGRHLHPFGVSYLRSPLFRMLHRKFHRWKYTAAAVSIVDGKGRFATASLLQVPNVIIDGVDFGSVQFVERSDDSTYALMAKVTGLDVAGDIGLAALDPAWIKLDFAHSRMSIGR